MLTQAHERRDQSRPISSDLTPRQSEAGAWRAKKERRQPRRSLRAGGAHQSRASWVGRDGWRSEPPQQARARTWSTQHAHLVSLGRSLASGLSVALAPSRPSWLTS